MMRIFRQVDGCRLSYVFKYRYSQLQYSAKDHSLLKQIYTYSYQDHYMGYIVLDHPSKSIIAIDPGEFEAIYNNIQMLKQELQYTLTHVLQTHGKSNHSASAQSLYQQFEGVKVMCGDAGTDTSCFYTHLARDLTPFTIGDISVCFMRSPGHTKDSFIVALTHAPDSVHSKLPILFTGDTLLLSSIGEIEDAAAYWQTLQRFRGFQGETLVFPGHRLQKENLLFAKTLDPSNQVINAKLQQIQDVEQNATRPHFIPTTLMEERLANPFLRLTDPQLQATLRSQDPLECMRKLRLIQQNMFGR